MKKMLLIVFIAASVCKTNESKAQVNVQDSLVLINLYDSCGGASWSDRWNRSVPVQNWYGITVAAGRVTEIAIEGDNLNGVIPSTLGNLSDLNILDLSFNHITGTIPSSLANLSDLTDLDLGSNQLSGNIPPALSKLSNLSQLYLDNNQLSGGIPSSLGNLSNLSELDLESNQLSGNIPSSFGNFSKLLQLSLGLNQLTGNIPTSLGNLSNLQYLGIENNQLSDTIPSSLGNLSNLSEININNNQLSGAIPSSLNGLVKLNLSIFRLFTNKFNFTALEDIATYFPFAQYVPQANIPLDYKGDELSVSAGGTLANDTFHWYRNNIFLKTIVGDSVLSTKIKGAYSVQVTNAVAPITLYSDTVTIADTSIPTITTIPAVVTNLCPGTSVTLTSSAKTGNLWSTGATTQSITTDTAGAYTVKANSHTSAVTHVSYQTCGKPTRTSLLAITPTAAAVSWAPVSCAEEYTLQYIQSGKTTYNTITLSDTSYIITKLLPSTTYQWKVRTVCIDSPMKAGAYTALSSFTTPEKLTAAFLDKTETGVILYPNPAHTAMTVSFNAENSYTSLQVLSATGQSMMQKQVATYAGKNTSQIDVSKLASGIYMLLIKTKSGIQTKQFVKE